MRDFAHEACEDAVKMTVTLAILGLFFLILILRTEWELSTRIIALEKQVAASQQGEGQ
jgi:hypothetical protein